eukprot:6798233-Alexandrium_andersonii.AAC.1
MQHAAIPEDPPETSLELAGSGASRSTFVAVPSSGRALRSKLVVRTGSRQTHNTRILAKRGSGRGRP